VEPVEAAYGLTLNQLVDCGGGGMMRSYYNDSVTKAIQTELPNVPWQPWRFAKSSTKWWDDLYRLFYADDAIGKTVVQVYIEDLKSKLGVTDWRLADQKLGDVDSSHVKLLGGLLSILVRLYPEQRASWFEELPTKYWTEFAVQFESPLPAPSAMLTAKEYFYHLQHKIGIDNLEKWYSFTPESVGVKTFHKVQRLGGLPLLLARVGPSHNWKPWRFAHLPQGYWIQLFREFSVNDSEAVSTVRDMIETLAKEYNVTHLTEWYRASGQLSAIVSNRLRIAGGLATILDKLYPEHSWIRSRFVSGNKRSLQLELKRYLELVCNAHGSLIVLHLGLKLTSLYPEVLEEATPAHLGLLGDIADQGDIRFDLSVPSLKLVVEYHGPHHYVKLNNEFLSEQQHRDKIKRELCAASGITLIEVCHTPSLGFCYISRIEAS